MVLSRLYIGFEDLLIDWMWFIVIGAFKVIGIEDLLIDFGYLLSGLSNLRLDDLFIAFYY